MELPTYYDKNQAKIECVQITITYPPALMLSFFSFPTKNSLLVVLILRIHQFFGGGQSLAWGCFDVALIINHYEIFCGLSKTMKIIVH